MQMIDKEELLELLGDAERDAKLQDEREAETIKKCIRLVRGIKAVEVANGRWVNPYMNRYGHPCHCCSVCGFKASYQDKNYCPNCGAKMDGGDVNG